jgi:DNA invertase Pin-like site-specific DNA recombinase
MSNETALEPCKIGYARISTSGQDESLQLDALAKAGCTKVFTDTASGMLQHRPALDAMLGQIRSGDVLVIWRLDRLARSLKHLLEISALLQSKNVGLRSLCESIDTTTPAGRLTFHVLGSVAQFERDLLVERTQAGLAAARARGRRGGRPTVWTDEKLRTAFELYDDRNTDVAGIARILGLSRASVYRAIANRDATTVMADGSSPPLEGQPTGPLR